MMNFITTSCQVIHILRHVWEETLYNKYIVFLHFVKPHVIVHCAAERRPDVVERHTEAAMNLNVHACATLAKEAGEALVCC